jgi:hypothetical protein
MGAMVQSWLSGDPLPFAMVLFSKSLQKELPLAYSS